MSKFNTTNIENISGGPPTFSQGLSVEGTNITSLVTMTEYYTGASEPSSPANGAVWYNGSNTKQYVNGDWYTITLTPPPSWFGPKAVFLGFDSKNQFIYKISNLDTLSNAAGYGGQAIVSGSISYTAAVSNGSRGVWGGGAASGAQDPANYIQYLGFVNEGNTTDFGDLTVNRSLLAAASNAVRGVFGGGAGDGDDTVMDYITIDTTGNAIDFGDLTVGRWSLAGAGGTTYGLFMAGNQGVTIYNTIDYITIATTGNATDFGDLLSATVNLAATSNKTRTVAGGGTVSSSKVNVIQYMTTDTPGNATDFGDLTLARSNFAAVSNGTRAVFVAGASSNFSNTNTMDYITMDTLGNAADFGDFLFTTRPSGAASGQSS